MSRLDRIRFDDGEVGYQEVAEDGSLLALYDEDGDQYPDVHSRGNCTWELVETVGEFSDSDGFWNLISRSTGAGE